MTTRSIDFDQVSFKELSSYEPITNFADDSNTHLILSNDRLSELIQECRRLIVGMGFRNDHRILLQLANVCLTIANDMSGDEFDYRICSRIDADETHITELLVEKILTQIVTNALDPNETVEVNAFIDLDYIDY